MNDRFEVSVRDSNFSTECDICNATTAKQWIFEIPVKIPNERQIVSFHTVFLCDKEQCFEYLKLLNC